jgi:hypothetical protein
MGKARVTLLERRGVEDADRRPAGTISVQQIPSVSRQRWRVAQAEVILAASRARAQSSPAPAKDGP